MIWPVKSKLLIRQHSVLEVERRVLRRCRVTIGPRILVIEDDRMFRGLLVSLLRKHGHDVESASDGENGFSKVFDIRPNIVLMELCLPNRDGLQILKSIRSTETLDDIRTFIITSDLSQEMLDTCMKLGADQYMVKARFTKEEFFLRFDELVDSVQRQTASREQRFDHPVSAIDVAVRRRPMQVADSSTAADEIVTR